LDGETRSNQSNQIKEVFNMGASLIVSIVITILLGGIEPSGAFLIGLGVLGLACFIYLCLPKSK